MPHKKCYICNRGCVIDDFDLTCEECRNREMDVLIAVYWLIHCCGSDYCPVNKIYNDIDPVGGLRPDPQFVRSWINKGYLELNEIGCVGVPKCLADHLKEKGYNITPAFHSTLNRVKSESMDKRRKELVKPVERAKVENKTRIGMVYTERSRGR